jgi:hypothetical protein
MKLRLRIPHLLSLCTLAIAGILSNGDLRAENLQVPDTFIVQVGNPSEFQPSNYKLDFQLSCRSFKALNRGGFEIKFPEGTILDSIGDILIDDNHSGISYRLDYKKVYDRTLILNLRRPRDSQAADDDDDDDGGHNCEPVAVTVSMADIINPIAGTYRLEAKVFNKDDETIAGPLESNQFGIADSTTFPRPLYALVPGSIKPDTLYSHKPFELSFDINFIGYPQFELQPPDSARITVTINSIFPEHILDTIFSGIISAPIQSGDTFSYSKVPLNINGPESGGESGARTLNLNFVAYSDGDSSTLNVNSSDSVYLFQVPEISLVPNSLQPDSVIGGEMSAFYVDVLVSSDFPLILVPFLEYLQFWPQTMNSFDWADIRDDTPDLLPGVNRIQTLPKEISANWSGETVHVGAQFLVRAPGMPLSYEGWSVTTDSSGNTLTVLGIGDNPTLQILNLAVVSPNTPRVNIGQSFLLRATIANTSNVAATGVRLKLQSDGSSQYDTLITLGDISALDTTTIDIPITASGQPSLAEVFRVDIEPGAHEVLAPINDLVTVFIDLPAILELEYNLFGVQSGFVSPGDRFSLTVELKNIGDAPITNAHYLLTTGLVEFGNNDSIVGTVALEQNVVINFDAPLFDTSVFFVFQLIDTPIDLNSGLPAVVQQPAILFPIRVERIEGEVVASAQSIGSSLAFPKTDRQFFSLTLKNQGQTANSRVDLRRLFLSVRDQNGSTMNASEALEISTVRITEDGQDVAFATAIGHRLAFTIDNLILPPNQSREIAVSATPSLSGGRNFVLSLNVEDIEGVYIAGPLANQRAQIVSLDGSSLLFERLFLFTAKSISESFRIETNPCNPDEQPVRFAYVLESATDVEFRMFTLGGAEIYAINFSSGSGGGAQGEHVIEWDGRNRIGKPVMNGVYIASIKLMATGEFVRRKVAVVR